jgi:hypothetical protein
MCFDSSHVYHASLGDWHGHAFPDNIPFYILDEENEHVSHMLVLDVHPESLMHTVEYNFFRRKFNPCYVLTCGMPDAFCERVTNDIPYVC